MTLLLTRLLTFVNHRLNRDESGATAVEYALIIGVIALVVVGAATTLGSTISGIFDDTNTEIGTP